MDRLKTAILLLLGGLFFILENAGGADFHPPEPYQLETLYKRIKTACPSKEWPCFEEKLFGYTMKYGPRGAIETFTLLKERGDIDPSIDPHHFAHHVGHHTAMAFGTSSQAFALCPSSYHYGCFHGFFQQALSAAGATEEDATKICSDLEKDPSVTPETKFSCYHGLGHGTMMHTDWDLSKALTICDQLKSATGQSGCWQGVFMENVDQAEEGKWWQGHFSQADPLAPCDTLDKKYQHECFINHFGWLMTFYHGHMDQAVQACLKANGEAAIACVSSIGLATTNASWQRTLLPGSDPNKVAENAWKICQEFPAGYVGYCVSAGLDNILATNNTDVLDIKTSQDFCQAVGPKFSENCFKQLGQRVRYFTQDFKKTQDICRSLPNNGQTACLTGTGPS